MLEMVEGGYPLFARISEHFQHFRAFPAFQSISSISSISEHFQHFNHFHDRLGGRRVLSRQRGHTPTRWRMTRATDLLVPYSLMACARVIRQHSLSLRRGP